MRAAGSLTLDVFPEEMTSPASESVSRGQSAAYALGSPCFAVTQCSSSRDCAGAVAHGSRTHLNESAAHAFDQH